MSLLHFLVVFVLICLITVDGKLKEGECEGENLAYFLFGRLKIISSSAGSALFSVSSKYSL